jgi:hypothetical protein
MNLNIFTWIFEHSTVYLVPKDLLEFKELKLMELKELKELEPIKLKELKNLELELSNSWTWPSWTFKEDPKKIQGISQDDPKKYKMKCNCCFSVNHFKKIEIFGHVNLNIFTWIFRHSTVHLDLKDNKIFLNLMISWTFFEPFIPI